MKRLSLIVHQNDAKGSNDSLRRKLARYAEANQLLVLGRGIFMPNPGHLLSGAPDWDRDPDGVMARFINETLRAQAYLAALNVTRAGIKSAGYMASIGRSAIGEPVKTALLGPEEAARYGVEQAMLMVVSGASNGVTVIGRNERLKEQLVALGHAGAWHRITPLLVLRRRMPDDVIRQVAETGHEIPERLLENEEDRRLVRRANPQVNIALIARYFDPDSKVPEFARPEPHEIYRLFYEAGVNVTGSKNQYESTLERNLARDLRALLREAGASDEEQDRWVSDAVQYADRFRDFVQSSLDAGKDIGALFQSYPEREVGLFWYGEHIASLGLMDNSSWVLSPVVNAKDQMNPWAHHGDPKEFPVWVENLLPESHENDRLHARQSAMDGRQGDAEGLLNALKKGVRLLSNLAIVDVRDVEKGQKIVIDTLTRSISDITQDNRLYLDKARLGGLPGGMTADELARESREMEESRPDGIEDMPRLSGMQFKCSVNLDVDEQGVPLIRPATHGRPFTHLLKYPTERYYNLPVVEAMGLHLARAAGLEVPEFRLVPISREGGEGGGIKTQTFEQRTYSRDFEDMLPHLKEKEYQPYALLVERFDIPKSGEQVRIMAEDLCSASGRRSRNKYDPSIEMLAGTIGRMSSDREADMRTLFKGCVVNHQLSNADGHAKNLSMLTRIENDPDGTVKRTCRLAPFYDITVGPALLLPYSEYKIKAPYTIRHNQALSINGTKDPGLEDFMKLAQSLGIPDEEAEAIVVETALRILHEVRRMVAAWEGDNPDLFPADCILDGEYTPLAKGAANIGLRCRAMLWEGMIRPGFEATMYRVARQTGLPGIEALLEDIRNAPPQRKDLEVMRLLPSGELKDHIIRKYNEVREEHDGGESGEHTALDEYLNSVMPDEGRGEDKELPPLPRVIQLVCNPANSMSVKEIIDLYPAEQPMKEPRWFKCALVSADEYRRKQQGAHKDLGARAVVSGEHEPAAPSLRPEHINDIPDVSEFRKRRRMS